MHNFAVSVDGFAAGPDQGVDDPLGVGGRRLHEWVFATPTGAAMLGLDPGVARERSIDDDYLARGEEGIGATIMGRNMFGPVRGPWPDEEWKGWWGDEPPYHHPVFVLTHHPRPPLTMAGGTTFHFVDDTIATVAEQAFAAAAGGDVRLGGGVSTVRAYLRAGLVDEVHLAIVPVLLGRGERLFEGLDDLADRYDCVELVAGPSVAHVRLARRQP